MDNNFYQNFEKNSHKGSGMFFRFIVSFIAGMLGATIVLGTYNYSPFFKNTIANKTQEETAITASTVSTPITENQVSLSNYSDTAIYAANKALPSIVGIEVEYTINTYFGQTQTTKATGSGIIISKDGYILTNNHIINATDSSSFYEVSKANSVKVTLYKDETKYDAKIIGTDKQTDLAVIKIEKNDLTPAELGNSSNCSIGEFVLAVGNPLGLESSVTAGIISALERKITLDDGSTYVVIQSDCAINAGNSGGALVNSKGQVIGINTLKLSGTGIEGMGFAIPINDTINIYEELIKNGKIARPYIGITGVDLTEKQAEYYKLPVGIYINSIELTSSAEAAGIKVGDVITAIDGTHVKTMKELNEIKNKKNIGDQVTLTITREGKSQDITLTLKEQPANVN